MNNYFIKENYKHRKEVRYHDDTKKSYNSVRWQKEVYLLAKKYTEDRNYKKIYYGKIRLRYKKFYSNI